MTREGSLKGWKARRAKRVSVLEQKLAKRRGTAGMGENVAHLEAEIARLKEAGV